MAPRTRPAACVPAPGRVSAFGDGGRADLQAAPHEIQQARPVLTVQIGGQRAQRLEEGPPRPDLAADELIIRIGQFQQGVPREGQQVQRRQQRGQVLLAVSEIVFEMIALRFEHVVVFVFDLPTRAPGGDPPGHGVRRELPVGDLGVVLKHFPGVIRHRQVAPVDRQSVVRIDQRHRVGPAINVLFPPVGLALGPQRERVQIAARHERFHPLREVRMRRGLAGEQEMKTVQ